MHRELYQDRIINTKDIRIYLIL